MCQVRVVRVKYTKFTWEVLPVTPLSAKLAITTWAWAWVLRATRRSQLVTPHTSSLAKANQHSYSLCRTATATATPTPTSNLRLLSSRSRADTDSSNKKVHQNGL